MKAITREKLSISFSIVIMVLFILSMTFGTIVDSKEKSPSFEARVHEKLPIGATGIRSLGNYWYQFNLQEKTFLVLVDRNTGYAEVITLIGDK